MRFKSKKAAATTDPTQNQAKETIPDTKLPAALKEKMQMLKPYLQKGADIITRPFFIEGEPPLEAVSIH